MALEGELLVCLLTGSSESLDCEHVEENGGKIDTASLEFGADGTDVQHVDSQETSLSFFQGRRGS